MILFVKKMREAFAHFFDKKYWHNGLVLKSLTKENPIAANIVVFEIISGDFPFDIDNGILSVLIRSTSMRRF